MRIKFFRSRPSLATLCIAGISGFCIAGALVFGGWSSYPKGLSQFRNPILATAGFLLLLCLVSFAREGITGVRSLLTRLKSELDPDLLRVVALFIYGIAFLKAVTLDYLAFSIPALDGSIYDYAMMNTLRGNFMYTITEGNHFGVHATPILFLLLPFHALFHSPLFAVFLHPMLLFVGAVLFDRCIRAREIEGWPRFFFLFAYLNSTWISRTLHYSFHVEVFYPIFFFWIDLALRRKDFDTRSKLLFWSGSVLFLAVKEDAPFHFIALMAAYVVIRKLKVSTAILGAFLATITAFLYLKVIIPANSPTGGYHFVSSASGAGKTLGEALQYLFSNPGYLIKRYFTGGWWNFLFPALGVLIFSPFFWLASLPLLGLYSLAGDAQMFHLTIYYAVPLVGPFFLGLLEGYRRSWQRSPWFSFVALLAILVIGSGYMIFRRADLDLWRDTRNRLSLLPKEAKICAPSSLVPQISYGNVRLLDLACMESEDYVAFLPTGSKLSKFPYDDAYYAQIREKLENWKRLDPAGNAQVEIYRRP